MFCSKCGVKVDDEAKECKACGQPLPAGAPAPAAATSVDKSHTSGKAIAGFILGLAGLIIFFFSFLLGILAVIFSALAKSDIGKNKNLTGNGLATAGLILGIIDIVLIGIGIFAAIAIPNFISMQTRAREAMVKNQMHTIQLAMEDYSTLDQANLYPTSLDSRLPDGKVFTDLLPTASMTNVFTHEPVKITFKDFTGRIPDDVDMEDVPRGDIYIYCDGRHYVIIGGGRGDRPLYLKLRSDLNNYD
jgi:type II secretory pathway pseudopilin PulG